MQRSASNIAVTLTPNECEATDSVPFGRPRKVQPVRSRRLRHWSSMSVGSMDLLRGSHNDRPALFAERERQRLVQLDRMRFTIDADYKVRWFASQSTDRRVRRHAR